MQYSQLPKIARRFIQSDGLPDQLRFSTKQHYICRGFAVLGLLPLSASLVMAVTLDGVEQTFYQIVVGLLLVIVILLGSLKHHFVLDNSNKHCFCQLQLLGVFFKKKTITSLKSTQLLYRHNRHDRSLFELKIGRDSYNTGSLTDTMNTALFIAQRFDIQVNEQVSDYPNIHPIDISSLASSSTESITSANVNTQDAQIDLVSQKLATAENIKVSNQVSVDFIEPLFCPKKLVKILYPLPFLMLFAVMMKFVGGYLNVF
ncbi:hypothetical protein L2735_04510 [Shewanella olleyana]|uniref:hypothetical protein n=1 Tax=Shewanella olleyana TaxID=135626 RepID=UPI00200D50F6|nr:hypothetical protein [Shewanella olleyana]MCL1066069.1 hypothetical protein [Shewanella olleyana]